MDNSRDDKSGGASVDISAPKSPWKDGPGSSVENDEMDMVYCQSMDIGGADASMMDFSSAELRLWRVLNGEPGADGAANVGDSWLRSLNR